MKEDYTKVLVKGFDSYGEPEIRILDEGGLYIVFNFMPPLDKEGNDILDPIFDSFDEALQDELGVEVEQIDDEFYFVPDPAEDTVEKAKAYLESFWKSRK